MGSAQGYTFLGFEHATPLDPQAVEAGGAAAGGDSHFAFYGLTRIGVIENLDASLRAGMVTIDGPDDKHGFEVEGAARARFLRVQDTRAVDLAVVGGVSIMKVSKLFVLGLDGQVVASRHFKIATRRQLFVAAGLGLAIDYLSIEHSQGSSSDIVLEAGLLGSLSAGVDIIERVRASITLQLRDDLERAGLAVTYFF